MVGSDTEATVMLNVVPGLNTGITALNAGLSSINAQFQNVTDAVSKSFGMVDAMIVSTGVMVAQFGMGAANAFGEFEQGMQIVKAVSQQSGQSIAFLKQEAQDFSVQYRTGIDSITEGLQTLGRAGLNSAQEQTEVLEEGLQTAKLEGRDLNSVLEEIIQNTALLGGDVNSSQFGEQAEYLNNLLVGTSLSAPIDTHDISETLKYSGGMVAAAGGTIATDEGYADEQGREIVEDYMGAIAAFAQKGVKGSIAGTALRAFFNKPASQDESVVEALNSIGLAPEDLWNDEETMKPISEQIELIQTQMAVKNVSKMDQMQLWSKIVGGKMGQQMMKLDAQDIREMTTDIQDAKSAKELSEQTFNTYNQQVNKFTEEGQKAFREFGQYIVTAVRPALSVLTALMDVMSNPVVSFGGFIAFVAIMGHAVQSFRRILGGLKNDLSSVFFGGNIQDEKFINIRRPSDSIDRVPTQNNFQGLVDQKKKTKQEYFNTIKSNISSIQQQISNMIETIDNKFDGLDMNVDVNLDDVKGKIQDISTTANTVIKQSETNFKAAIAKMKAELIELQKFKINTLGDGSSLRDMRKHPITVRNRTVTDLMSRLPKKSRKLLNEQLRDGTLNFDDLFHSGNTGFSDPFYKNRNHNLSPFDDEQSYYQQESEGNFTMFPHQMTSEELDMARQYMGVPNMDDFIKFQIMMKEAFPNLPHQWVMDSESGGYVNLRGDEWDKSYQAKIAADEQEMYNKAKAVLDELFDGAKNAARLAAENEKAEMLGVWGGLSEEEFNNQYYQNKFDELGYVKVNGWTQSSLGENAPYLLPLNEPSEKNLSGVEKMWDDIEKVTDEDLEANKAISVLFDNEGGRKELSKATDKIKDKFNGLAQTLGSKSTSTFGKAIDILGGKFSAAVIAATAAMEIYNHAFGQWQKQVQEHQTKLSDAQDAVSEAEGNIREEYLKNNPGASQADADNAINEAYLSIEDNNYDLNSLDENTRALYTATYQVQRASNLLEKDAMDGNFGIGGKFTRISDDLGGAIDLLTLNYGTNLVMDSGEFSSVFDNSGVSVSRGAISDNNGNAVLKSSQSSEDYIYSKENAAIFAADVWDALDKGVDVLGSYGMGAYFGTDSAHFQEVNRSIFGGSTGFGNSYYTNVIDMLGDNFQSQSSQHQLQMFLKNNKQDAQKLAKDIRKFEKANKGRSPISYFTDKKGGRVPNQKALKNLEVKDKDLVKYLRSLSIKTGMSAQQLLMASQLQQMQDLNQVMTEQLQPQVIGIAQNAYQQLSAQQGIGSNTNNTSSGAWSTYNAAAAIASQLNVLVEQALDTEMQQDYIAAGGDNPEYIDNPQKMKADMVKAFNTPESQRTQEQKDLVNTYGKKWFESYYLSGWETGHPNATPQEREAALKNFDKTMAQYDNFGKLIADTRKGANDYYTKGLLAAYDASSIGESTPSSSGGSGGSGGDGKDKDKDTGTKKERVDLVLCNKKEIPKLNVNLFKKAPQFTILNKNFKLRDIKINTQDKPKAVLDSIKNAVIDVSKRMDPKIIQDENAEYDPVASTDGNSIPSGSTGLNTD